MLQGALYSDGQDHFEDLVFSAREWSAPTMISAEEIRKRLESFALCGRRIKEMKLIGLNYALTRLRIEEEAYDQLEHLPEEERQYMSDYVRIDPGMQFVRYAMIDEPLLIGFEDGDVFEIDTPQSPEFRMSMSCIPWEINAGGSRANTNADILFSPCIGQRISAVEVNTFMTDMDPMLYCAFNEPPYRRELVSDILLRFENGGALRIGPSFDYCTVICVNEKNETMTISFSELQRGLCNREDLHPEDKTEQERIGSESRVEENIT